MPTTINTDTVNESLRKMLDNVASDPSQNVVVTKYVPQNVLSELSRDKELGNSVLSTFAADTWEKMRAVNTKAANDFSTSNFDISTVVPDGRREVFDENRVDFARKYMHKASIGTGVTPQIKDQATLLTTMSFAIWCAIAFFATTPRKG